MSGQKSGVTKSVTEADPSGAIPYLQKALDSKMLSTSSARRLKSTIDLCGGKKPGTPRRPKKKK
jgi:hypothetical protein